MTPPPWIGKVQYDWLAEAVGANSSTGGPERRISTAKKLPNKADFVQPIGNQWFTAGFQYGGTASSARPDGSLQRDTNTRGPPPKGERPRGTATGQQRTIGAAELPSNRITKQTQFLRTLFDLATYKKVLGRRLGGADGELKVAKSSDGKRPTAARASTHPCGLVRPAAAVGSCLPADALGKLQTLDYFGQVFGEVSEALGFRLPSEQTLLEREFQR